MAEPVYTIDQYNALCAAIAEGVLRVHYGDKIVEYRKLEDMLRIKNMMAEDLGLNQKSTRTYATFDKGL